MPSAVVDPSAGAKRPAEIQLAGLTAPVSEWEAVSTCPRRLLVGGEWRQARAGRMLEVHDPATGHALCEVPDADERDALDALTAATEAMPAWSACAPRERARVLRRSAEAMLRDADRLAMLITLEMGKPLAESHDEVRFAAEYLDWCADESVRIAGSVQQSPDGTSRIMVVRRPVGPCLLITPWNFPLAVPARGVAAALAAGCSVVLRPSALTPLSAMAFAAILMSEGLPAGVLNIVVSGTNGSTDVLLRDPRLRRLTFTGSTTVGRHLVERSADQLLRVGVELGGQAPFIVFPDADLALAVEGAVAAKMRNGGQACTAANHFHVHRELVDEFTDRLARRLAEMTLGRGTEPGVDLGPMIAAPHRRRLVELLDDAVDRGARIVLRGGEVPGPGQFFAPVVLRDAPDEARVCREEIFGPIACVSAFEREAEVVGRANGCRQGLGAYVYTRDVDRALRVGEALEVGMVAVNRGRISSVASPFGGAKHSGFGLAGGTDPLADYLQTRSLTIAAACDRSGQE